MNRRNFLKSLLGLFFIPPSLKNEANDKYLVYSQEDMNVLTKLIEYAEKNNLYKLKYTDLIIEVAKFFINYPYVANTLDKQYPEKIIINLREFDCLTFVENVLAISNCIRWKNLKWEAFVSNIAFIRYRAGSNISYKNRLHYLTEWLTDNHKKKMLHIIQGSDYMNPKPIFLLSKNQLQYIQTPEKSRELEYIQRIERQKLSFNHLSGFKCDSLSNLPTQDGDIICFASNIEGLDFNHVAFKYKNSFIHASSVNNKIEINAENLAEYCGRVKANWGIVIARPI